MKAAVMTGKGTKKGSVDLPLQFNEPVRFDLIKRAVLAIQSHKRQPYGADPEAGKKYSSKLSRRRRDYKTAYGIGISRVPRKIMSHSGTRFNWEGATAPNTRGGRQAHPPKVQKNITEKINKKERRKAIRSAMAAAVDKDIVTKRGHLVDDYPFVLEDSFEKISKTKDLEAALVALGLEKELERSGKRYEKTGNARRRGRAYKTSVGPLFVVSEKCDLMSAASNLGGVDVVEVTSLNAELLAPGCDAGRLTLFTESALKKLDKEKLFVDSPAKLKLKAGKKAKKKVKKSTKKTTGKKKKTKKARKKKKAAKKTTKKSPSKKKSSKKKTKKSSSKKSTKKKPKKSTKKTSKKSKSKKSPSKKKSSKKTKKSTKKAKK